MSSRMNFDDTVSTKFEFQVGGKDFDLIYPTLTQMKPIEEGLLKIKESKKPQEEKDLEMNMFIVKSVRDFVVPVGHDEKFEDVLNQVSLNTARTLNTKLVELLFQGE